MKLSELKTVQFKKRTFSKMKWGVHAYNQWRVQKLSDVNNYDEKVFESNLEKPNRLMKDAFRHALCMFIPEVMKIKDGSDYPGIIYEMVTYIQKYLLQNKVFWKLIDDPEFLDVHTVLDNVMKE